MSQTHHLSDTYTQLVSQLVHIQSVSSTLRLSLGPRLCPSVRPTLDPSVPRSQSVSRSMRGSSSAPHSPSAGRSCASRTGHRTVAASGPAVFLSRPNPSGTHLAPAAGGHFRERTRRCGSDQPTRAPAHRYHNSHDAPRCSLGAPARRDHNSQHVPRLTLHGQCAPPLDYNSQKAPPPNPIPRPPPPPRPEHPVIRREL